MPDQLSSYIAINADGSVSAFFGKMDMGQGLYVSIGQMVAEELDVPFDRVTVLMADTRTSVNQGGASGSTGIQRGGVQMRAAAAEARRVLVEMAAEKLKLPADQLTVTDGVVHAKSDAAKKATYAELIGGRYFNVQLEWNKQIGNNLYAPGKAKPKDPKDYKIVGKPIKRADIAPKVFCPGAVRHRREDSRHAACPHDPPAGRGRDPGQGRRGVDQGHPGRARGARQQFPRRGGRQGMGRGQGVPARSRSSGRTRRRRSPSRPRSTTTSARRRCASARTSSRSAMSTRRSRPPPA